MLNSIFEVQHAGIKVKADMLLGPYYHNWDKEIEVIPYIFSIYGSELAVKTIWGALGQNHHIDIYIDEQRICYVCRDYESINVKLTKINYAKYHCLIWQETVQHCIVKFQDETLEQAWERFLQRRKIPILKEWIRPLHQLLLKEYVITPLYSLGLQGWEITGNDDEICNLIVKNLDIFSVQN